MRELLGGTIRQRFWSIENRLQRGIGDRAAVVIRRYRGRIKQASVELAWPLVAALQPRPMPSLQLQPKKENMLTITLEIEAGAVFVADGITYVVENANEHGVTANAVHDPHRGLSVPAEVFKENILNGNIVFVDAQESAAPASP